jgi:hypothetical protein
MSPQALLEVPLAKKSMSSRISSNSSTHIRDEERDEEDAFWIFVQMVESILPLDYYSNMVGALIDQKIFYQIFKR